MGFRFGVDMKVKMLFSMPELYWNGGMRIEGFASIYFHRQVVAISERK
jgi:hypothetical protein